MILSLLHSNTVLQTSIIEVMLLRFSLEAEEPNRDKLAVLLYKGMRIPST